MCVHGASQSRCVLTTRRHAPVVASASLSRRRAPACRPRRRPTRRWHLRVSRRAGASHPTRG
eukprot:4893026-Prymnesium_polylepis.1